MSDAMIMCDHLTEAYPKQNIITVKKKENIKRKRPCMIFDIAYPGDLIDEKGENCTTRTICREKR